MNSINQIAMKIPNIKVVRQNMAQIRQELQDLIDLHEYSVCCNSYSNIALCDLSQSLEKIVRKIKKVQGK